MGPPRLRALDAQTLRRGPQNRGAGPGPRPLPGYPTKVGTPLTAEAQRKEVQARRQTAKPTGLAFCDLRFDLVLSLRLRASAVRTRLSFLPTDSGTGAGFPRGQKRGGFGASASCRAWR